MKSYLCKVVKGKRIFSYIALAADSRGEAVKIVAAMAAVETSTAAHLHARRWVAISGHRGWSRGAMVPWSGDAVCAHKDGSWRYGEKEVGRWDVASD